MVLSEFQAANLKTLRDEDGNYEDWLEVANVTANTINLAGWFLTDDSDQLTKWSFPSTNLAPGRFLVVFASNKDRRTPGKPLHTNFKLSMDGEYLALVKPDGVTLATVYDPYPAQAGDLSYGLPVSSQTVTLLGPEASGKFLAPDNAALGTNWIFPEFADASWLNVTTGVGFDLELSALTNLVTTSVAGPMHGVNASAYLRWPFTVDNPASLDQLKLSIHYNDGFIAYLNGTLVALRNAPVTAPGGIQADSLADWSATGQQGFNNWYYGYYDRGADSDGIYDPATDFTSTAALWTWNGGAWVLGPGNPPWDTISRANWQPNGDNSGGVHWPIRRWINETAGLVTCQIVFGKENPVCGSGATLHVFQNGIEQFSWTLAHNDPAGLNTNLVLESIQPGDYLDFALDPQGVDGSSNDLCDSCTFSVVIDQLPSEGAIWNSAATESRSIPETLLAGGIDLSKFRDRLLSGPNLLAIHGLNASPSDPNFLIRPELIGNQPGMSVEQQAYFTTPTPGAANATGSPTLGPIITEISHTPTVPGNDDDLLVQARVTPSLRAVKSVTLKYRTMYAAEVTTPMFDDGHHGDGQAGDSIYGAWIPASAAVPGQMLRYYLVALDNSNQQTRAPSFSSATRSPQYFGTVVDDPVLTNSRLPVLHWFIPNPSAADTDVTARCSVFFKGEFYDNIGVDLHGQSTRTFPKKSYDLSFNPGYKFRWSQDAPRVSDLNLLTTWADKTHLRNELAHETYRDAGGPSHFAFPVRVQQNRAFFSVANLVENGDEDFLQRLGLDPQGALYKMYNNGDSVAMAEKKTRKNEGTADLQALINGMKQANATARQIYLFDHLDIPEMINFFAAKAITADVDCCAKNYYLYRDSDGTGEWQAMPWDVDLSFGRVWTCGDPCYQYYDQTIYTNQGIFIGAGNTVFNPLYATPATRQMFLRRLRTLMDEILQPPGTPATNDFYRLKTLALRDQIAPDAAMDLNKWGTWGTRETITTAVNRIWTEFLPGRREYLFRTLSVTNRGEIPAAQASNILVKIDGLEYRPASGNPLQEWLSLTNANSFAVDISNWRLDGGARFKFKPGTVIPSRSALYVSPDVKAFRSRATTPKGGQQRLVVGPYDGNLSAWGESLTLWDPTGRLVSSNSYVGNPGPAQSFLRITEIFYHPDPWAGNPGLDAQWFEFLELRNIGQVALDLRGVRLTEGVQFDFSTGTITNLAPGARLLLVANTNAFAGRYGGGLPVTGQFTGKLDNSGERLRLEDSYGEKILDFSFDNKWYPITDGHGYSLVMVDDSLPWSLWGEPTSWRPSGSPGGSPGQNDPSLSAFPTLVINEILVQPSTLAAIELFNPAPTNVNVGYWFLTDDFDEPRKFQIPDPTIIPPRGYVCFTAAQFNPTPGVHPSFDLDPDGGSVWLFSSDATGAVTGYVQGLNFGATTDHVSLGRFTNSVGEIDYPAQTAVTLGQANAAPLVGPIVISEIMYHPAPTPSNSPASFVELANLASRATPLFNPTEPTNTWRLRNAVDFDFPTNVLMPAGSRLLVVGFNPLTETATLAGFRTLYGVPPSVPIYGPWQGNLGNAEQTLELKRPEPAKSTSVPYVQVEKVHYLDHAPWPEIADGTGASLQRRKLEAYANEPTNWFGSPPTAGAPNQPNVLPSVQLTAPIQGSLYQSPTNILLSATATDIDGTIQRIEFHADGQKLGEISAEPYVFVWTNPAPGAHTLTALAVDDRLGLTESAPVGITVLGPPPTIAITEPRDRTLAPIGSNLTVTAQATAAVGAIDRVAFYSGNQLFAQMYAPPFTVTLSSSTPITHRLTAVATDSLGIANTSTVVRVAFASGTNVPVHLVPVGSRWKYLDNGSNQGTNWMGAGFDDTSWKSGQAELGYGDKEEGWPETTEISFGPDASRKWVTYYFRHTFPVIPDGILIDLNLSLLRDDGAAVYLNGQDVFRGNLPKGPLDYLQLATSTVSGADERTYLQKAVDASLVHEGTNVLAVEVHQVSRDSSDVSFDLSLTGTQILLAPAILELPASRQIPAGGTAVFSVDAAGAAPLSYQWRLNNAPILEATGPVLVITNAQATNTGSYQVLVSNALGWILSPVANLALTSAPPVVGNDGLLVPQNQATSVAESTLLANDVDPAGQPLVFSALSSSSQSGATLTRSAGQVIYQPPANFLGADSFTYTVRAASGLSAEGRVEVLVYSGVLPPASQLNIVALKSGYRVRYQGLPGRHLELQQSSDLAHWQVLLETTVPPHGMVEYLDTNQPWHGAYYRARQP